ncbi:MAG: nucleotidyltransferase domain-containing protein [Magnetococcales bacterium]|nr:nucleotidyltransferase domain-containing protein [Magnetococcales bacterium]NGZ07506.1 nucleotidyltransferase domain-containing protein [Magnetococcales bacterium]
MVTWAELERIGARIVEAIHPEQIIVFGSWVRGEITSDSDVDLLVITRDRYDVLHSRRQELLRLSRLLSKVPVPLDIALFNQDEVEYWKNSVNHMIAHALREGKVLYER